MAQDPTIKFNIIEGNIATITFFRPKAANALNSVMAQELKEAFAKLNDKIRVVILTGDGERVFCAGADLKERQGLDAQKWQVQHHQFRNVLQAIMECQVPVIAAVNGAAYGGGFELALGCDFIYASKNATFAFPEASLGIMPGMGGTQNLPRAVGLRRSKELLYTGQSFSANDAYYWGIVNKLCDSDKLMEETLACARLISKNAPLSVISIKRAATHGAHLAINEALSAESNHYNRLLHTSDRTEGINAYNEKRKPVFTGK
jgi:enoyl-CoA hydratase